MKLKRTNMKRNIFIRPRKSVVLKIEGEFATAKKIILRLQHHTQKHSKPFQDRFRFHHKYINYSSLQKIQCKME